MSFFFGDGFDLYTAITDCGTYWDASFGATATLGLSASGRFTGSQCLVSTATNNTPYVTKTSSVNDAVHHFSLAYRQTSALSGTNANFFITLYDGATAQCTIIFRQDGAIILFAGLVNSGTTLATYTGAVAAINTWYQYEIEVVISNTAGSIAVRKLGNTSNDFFLGSLNTRGSANNYANKIGIGSGLTAGTGNLVDDFLWRSDATSGVGNAVWLGDIRCYTRMPASDVQKQFTPLSGTTNYTQVDEAHQDGATTYVYSSTVGQSDLYTIGSIGSTPGSIVGVTTRAYMEKSDAGTRIAAVQLQSGASNVQGSLTLNTTWGWAFRNDLVDPATSAAWTPTGVNNAQIGVTVTA